MNSFGWLLALAISLIGFNLAVGNGGNITIGFWAACTVVALIGLIESST